MKAPACTIGTQAEAVCELFGGKKEDIKVIGIRHGEKCMKRCSQMRSAQKQLILEVSIECLRTTVV